MTGNPIATFFIAVATVLGAAVVFGAAARRVGQPAVVGEIIAGVALSPMVLSSTVSDTLFPADVKPMLGALANIGLAAFMFMIGRELDIALLRGRARATLGVAGGSVLLPLAGGIAAAVPLAQTYAPGNHTAFVLFTGVAMSVTAFPVLARILSDRGLNRSPIGGVALAAAAVGDLAAWSGLAGVVAYVGATGQWNMVLLPGYLILMATVVRPLLAALLRAAERREQLAAALLPTLVVGLALSCAATEWLGIHFIFGAFAFGAVLPRSVSAGEHAGVVGKLELLGAVLLPLYFVNAGMKVDFKGLGVSLLGVLALVLTVAIATKAVGVYLAARMVGIPHRGALPISVLMNTRGLTEIVILTVGLDAHLINQSFYSVMVVMAVLTTAMTGPLLRLLRVGPDGSEIPIGKKDLEGQGAGARPERVTADNGPRN
ncbi:cation:proton antiporter [Streptomyces sp. NPDC054940]